MAASSTKKPTKAQVKAAEQTQRGRNRLSELLHSLSAGTCCHAVCSDIDVELTTFISEANEGSAKSPVILVWDQLPRLQGMREEVLEELAKLAFGIWPFWHRWETDRFDANEAIVQQQHQYSQVIPAWADAAERACEAGRLPLFVSQFSVETQLRQLVLTLGKRASALILATRDRSPSTDTLDRWGRMGDWFASLLQLPVVLISPADMENRAALEDALGTRAVELFDPLFTSLPAQQVRDSFSVENESIPVDASFRLEVDTTLLGVTETRSETIPRKPKTRNCTSYIRPIHGMPHPCSEGEMRLWELLQKDVELAGLFRANWPTETICGTSYLADLVWRTGAVVVEVDGYFWHATPEVFISDRQRDYELQLSGYFVLRLPHDQVLEDPLAALEKIRRVVRQRI